MNKEEYKELHKLLASYKWHLIETMSDPNLNDDMEFILGNRLQNIDDLIKSMPVNLPPKNWGTISCYENIKEDK